jgi:hypothetical protein
MSNTMQNRIFEFRLDSQSGVPVYRQIIDQVLGGSSTSHGAAGGGGPFHQSQYGGASV